MTNDYICKICKEKVKNIMKHTTETGHNEYQHIENQELLSEIFKTPTLERLTKPKIENSSFGVYHMAGGQIRNC